LVSPLISAGTIFRASAGVIDHTSVLRTIHDRWGTLPLTERDKAAADVITLEKPRQDDPLQGVLIPVSVEDYPYSSAPSKLDKFQAARVAALPIRNEKGFYEEVMPDLTSAAAVSNFIRDRTAAWKAHVWRQQRRRGERR
jgi:phospholipase C